MYFILFYLLKYQRPHLCKRGNKIHLIPMLERRSNHHFDQRRDTDFKPHRQYILSYEDVTSADTSSQTGLKLNLWVAQVGVNVNNSTRGVELRK